MTDDPLAHHNAGPHPQTGQQPSSATREAIRKEFIDFVDHEYHLVIRFLMRCGLSLTDSQDAAQEAFTTGWTLINQRPTAWATIAEPRGWIRTVALHAHRRPPGMRRQQVPTIPLIPLSLDRPALDGDPAGLSAQTCDLLAALRRLPEDQRIALACRIDDLPTAAIAAQLKVTEQRVYDLLKKARATLKVILAATDSSTIKTERRTANDLL